jgi:hypothetical protein
MLVASGIDPMTVDAPILSASTASSIKVNTRVEDRPAMVVGSGYIAIVIGLVFLAAAGFTAYGAFWRDRSFHFSYWMLIAAVACLRSLHSLHFDLFAATERKRGADPVRILCRDRLDAGSARDHSVVPRHQVSQRVRYHECAKLKVNDLIGNPIEIGAVGCGASPIARRCSRSTTMPISSARRPSRLCGMSPAATPMISTKPARTGSDGGTRPEVARTLSLRESGDQVTDGLVAKLRERLEVAGVTIDEAWITTSPTRPRSRR